MNSSKVLISAVPIRKTITSPQNPPARLFYQGQPPEWFRSRVLPLLVALAAASWASDARAQVVGARIDKVWEFLINKPGIVLPTLTNLVVGTTDNEIGDGHYPMDTLSALKRYDANRLILGIRENGIDETDPNLTPAQLALSTNYPDRSLIWINPTNGAPMGRALVIGLYPVTLDPGFIAESIAAGINDYTNQYWWSFDVSDDGYIYTGYKNKILRYGPNGSGGISPTPQVVFTLTTNDIVHGNLYTTSGRFPKIRVRGTGTNTVILAGGNSGSRGAYRLSTTDGTNFVTTSWLPGGFVAGGDGGASSLIPSLNPLTPGDEWTYAASYPGNSSGADSSFSRFTTSPPFSDPGNNFLIDGSFLAGTDTGPFGAAYAAHFIGDVDTKAALPYVISYSTPSWNTRAVYGASTSPLPGWLAVHETTNGTFISSYKLDVTEDAELLSSDQAALFQATIGYVNVSAPSNPTNGTAEILWSSPVYGYGRYTLQIGVLLPAHILSIDTSGGVVTVTWSGFGNSFQLQRRSSLTSGTWVDVGTPVSGTSATDNIPPASLAFYRVATVN